ncbi:MAG: sigma-70 family RNA polymerase sigma factor [Lentisphaeraceae bacterium]|nr:sigma-70 family RNA polymerase sigma factor [Lentisphaeraceae bacterium]
MNTLHLKGLIQEIKQSEEKEKLEFRIKELTQLTGENSSDDLTSELTDLKERLTVLEIEESKRAEKSLQEIFLEYYPYIRKCLQLRKCPADIIDDLTQNAAIRIQRSLRRNRFKEVSMKGFLAWMRTIVHHTWADHWEQQRRLQQIREAEYQRYTDNDSWAIRKDCFVDADLVSLIFPRAVRKVFEEVTSLTYRSVCMRIIEGRSPVEVSEELGISSDVVDKQKSRFKTKLVRTIEGLYREMNSRLEDTIPDTPVFRKILGRQVDEIFNNDQLQPLTVSVSPEISGRLQWVQEQLDRIDVPEDDDWVVVFYEDKIDKFQLTENIGIGSRSGFREGNRIVLEYGEEAGLSGLHAMFEKDGDYWMIVDQHSTNGVMRNNKKVVKDYLNDRDVLQMGLVTIIYSADSAKATGED